MTAATLLFAMQLCLPPAPQSQRTVLPCFRLCASLPACTPACCCVAQGTNVWPAALLQVNPVARPTIGIGPYNTIIAAFTAVLAAMCCAVCWQQRQAVRQGSRDESGRPPGHGQCDAVVSVAEQG